MKPRRISRLTALNRAIGLALLAASPSTLAVELTESFIGIKFMKSYDSFYMVMVDEMEQPYLTPQQVSDWINTDLVCEQTCSFKIADTGNEYVIDAQNKIIRSNGEEFHLGEGAVSIDDKLWIRYDLWEEAFPLYMTWSLESYQLSFHPDFKLPSEIIQQYESDRATSIKAARQKKIEEEMSPIIPDSDFSGQFKLDWINTLGNGGELGYNTLFDGVADIYKGTLKLNAEYDISNTHGSYSWQYQRFNNPYFEYIGLGDTYSSGSLLFNPSVMTNSIKLERQYDRIGTGEFSIKEQTTPNASVDVYLNGFFIKTLNADSLGQYIVDNLNAKSGDVISLKELSKTGEFTEKSVQVTGDSSSFLTAGDYDIKIQASPETSDVFSTVQFGLANNLSVGLSHVQIEEQSHQVLMMAYRPIPQLSAIAHGSKYTNAYKVTASLEDYYFDVVYKSSPKFYQEPVFKSLDVEGKNDLSLNYRWTLPASQINGEYRDLDGSKTLEHELLHRYRQNYMLKAKVKQLWSNQKDDEPKTNYGLSGSYHFSSRGYVELAHEQINELPYYRVNFKYTGLSSAPWSQRLIDSPYTLTGQISFSDNKINWGTSLDWYHNEYVSGSFEVNSSGYLAQLKLSFGAGFKEDSRSFRSVIPHEHGSGSLNGYAYVELADNELVPIENAKIIASNKSVFTDENGYYEVGSLPANSDIYATVSPNSVDVTMDTSEAKKRIKLRPTTTVSADFILPMLVGVDGYTSPNYKSMMLTNTESGEQVNVQIENDGFFVIESIKPATYSVTFLDRNGGYVNKNQTLKIDKDVDWLSGVEI